MTDRLTRRSSPGRARDGALRPRLRSLRCGRGSSSLGCPSCRPPRSMWLLSKSCSRRPALMWKPSVLRLRTRSSTPSSRAGPISVPRVPAAGITALAEEKFPGTFKVFGLQGGGIKVDRINDGLIVGKDSSITSFGDLRGKTLGHLPGIQWRTISRHLVRKAGARPRQGHPPCRPRGRSSVVGRDRR